MGGTGLEQSALTPSKTTISLNDSTKSGTVNDKILEKFPELEQIISAWPELPEHIRKTILILVETNMKQSEEEINNE